MKPYEAAAGFYVVLLDPGGPDAGRAASFRDWLAGHGVANPLRIAPWLIPGLPRAAASGR